VSQKVYRGSPKLPTPFRQVRLGEGSKTLKLDAGSLDHLLQVDQELGIHWIVSSSEGVQRRRARGVEDSEHAQLLKADFVDSPVFLSCGGRNQLDTRLRPASVDISSGPGSMPTRPRSRQSAFQRNQENGQPPKGIGFGP
jgi:hypothetical protein